jgi:hypothetical protein
VGGRTDSEGKADGVFGEEAGARHAPDARPACPLACPSARQRLSVAVSLCLCLWDPFPPPPSVPIPSSISGALLREKK